MINILLNRFNPGHRFFTVLFFGLLTWVVFMNNSQVSLWDQDEAAYAGFAKVMNERGNYITPQFMWSEIHRKPPLHFWTIALSFKVFGVNTFAVRFPSALCILLTYVLIYFAGGKLWGKKAGIAAVAVLSTTLFVPVLAKVSVTDGPLLLLTTTSAFAVIHVLMNRRTMFWTLLFWVSFASGVLLKGPPIIIFDTVFVLIILIGHPERRQLLKLHPWFFLIPACLPFAWWCYLSYQQDGGEFLSWLADWYIFKRVGGAVLGQSGPPGMHLLLIIVFFLPWWALLPRPMWLALSGVFGKDRNTGFLLSAWFIASWFFYELSPSKLPAYVAGAHVPLAMLVAVYFTKISEGQKKVILWSALPQLIIFSLLLLSLIITPWFLDFTKTDEILISITAGVFLISFLFYCRYWLTGLKVSILFIVNMAFQLLIWGLIMPRADSFKDSSEKVALYAASHAFPQSMVLIGNKYGRPPSLPFYLSLNFKNIKEQIDKDSLLMAYLSPEPCVLILNNEQKEFLKKNLPKAPYTEISAQLTDRKQKAYYYIFINKRID